MAKATKQPTSTASSHPLAPQGAGDETPAASVAPVEAAAPVVAIETPPAVAETPPAVVVAPLELSFRVLSPLRRNGKRYKVGDLVNLDQAGYLELRAQGVVTDQPVDSAAP